MSTTSLSAPAPFSSLEQRSSSVAGFLLRYGLVLTLGWIGFVKFQRFEAEGIMGLIQNSPFMSWMYRVWGMQTVSNIIGSTELIAAGLLAVKPLYPRLSLIGSALCVVTFLTTLSFMFTTPGLYDKELGFPYISAGGFLLKDVILLGASVWTAADALKSSREH
ncbi:MAG: DUF417 family protein [Acidobacteriales bacterium]|nr:DUF417 family protein [Terriglobales bacterium]